MSGMDPLSAALDELKFRCVAFVDRDPRLPWRRVFPADVVSIHAVVEGHGFIETDELLSRHFLEEGEVVISNGVRGGALRAMDEGTVPDVISAQIELQAPLGHPMLAALPPLIRASSSSMPSSFDRCLHTLREELGAATLGRETIFRQMCASLFVLVLRRYVDRLGWTHADWFRMLADPLLREHLAAASKPETTVAALAAAAGRSRQRTCARFTRLGGTRPSLLLRAARLRCAVELLNAGETDLSRVARESGFGSRQALCRAFRRELGITPAAHWRSTHQRPFPRRKSRDGREEKDPSSTPGEQLAADLSPAIPRPRP